MFNPKTLLNAAFILVMACMLFVHPASPVYGGQPATGAPAQTTPISPVPVDAPAERNGQSNLGQVDQPLPQIGPSSVSTDSSLPDLSAYTPAGWDYPIVPSDVPYTNTVEALNTNGTYLDWAVANYGPTTTTTFDTCIYLDGSEIACSTHTGGLQGGYYSYLLDWHTGSVSAGSHTLKLTVDALNQVAEADENNNSWERQFIWSESCPGASYTPPLNEMGGTVMADTFPRPAALEASMAAERVRAAAYLSTAAPGRYDTSAYLAGTVAVGIVLPESAGNMENWSETEMNCVVSKIQAGTNWWKTRGGAMANLNFVYDVHRAIPTSYEPIDHSDGEVNLWIAEAMTGIGYSGANYWEQVYNYTDYLRSHYNTQWAMVYFVADSSNDPDGKFKNSQYFAWTYIGGPYIVMTYDNDGWGIGNMNWVAAHEFGHDFGAGDQYYAPGYGGCTSTTDRYGYLGVANSNCEFENPGSVPSLMRSNENALDTSAAGQVGWRDSNSNSIYDVLETQPAFNLSSHTPDLTSETSWSYTGSVYDQPWPHAVCGPSDTCNFKDITINSIAGASFRIDGGGWNAVTAVDGAFNSDSEQITFTTPIMTAGTHTVEVQATTSGSVTRNWTDTVTVQSCYNLTTAASPTYAGAISVLTAPNCGASKYISDTVVSLSTSANAGYSFANWSGDASGPGASTTVTMASNKTATANFDNRAPTLTGISPSVAAVGVNGQSILLTGSNFVMNSVVHWNGASLTTTYASSTMLTASVPAANLATPGIYGVTVFNPTPGGGTSSAATFTINNPIPVLTNLNPTSVTAGDAGFILTVTGTRFVDGAKIRWNGEDLITTYISSTQLSAAIPAAAIATPGTATITVYNPLPGGSSSGPKTFTVKDPLPTLNGLNPSMVTAGGVAFTLTVTGTNFFDGSSVHWNDATLMTTYISSTELQAVVPAANIAASGSAAVKVLNPAPGGGTSQALPLEITDFVKIFLPTIIR